MQDNLFLSNLSIVLAHSLVYETKAALSPNGIVDDARNSGDPPAPTTSESMASILRAYTQHLPELTRVIATEAGPTEQTLFNTRKLIAPQEQELNAQLMEQFLPRLITAQGDATSANELAQLRGLGGQAVRESELLNREIDPEFYSTRAATSGATNRLLDSINLNEGLSGGEEAAIERGLNRLNVNQGFGEGSIPRMQDIVRGASTFGDAAFAKRGQNRSALTAALQAASATLPAMRSGVDAFGQATGRQGTQPAPGFNLTGRKETGATSTTIGTSLLNTAEGIRQQENEINSQRRDSLDRATGFMGALPNIS